MKTRVVNSHKEKYDVYIGRGSEFGNPFVIGRDGNREEVIAKFAVYFQDRLLDSDFREALVKLRSQTLGCFCKPEACHGDLIAQFVDDNVPDVCSTCPNESGCPEKCEKYLREECTCTETLCMHRAEDFIKGERE